MREAVHLSPTCIFDPDSHSVIRRGHIYRLTDIQYRILECLLERMGEIVSAETIMRCVWGDKHTGTRENFNVQILRLRRRIELDYRAPKLIRTVRGSGYVLVVQSGVVRDG